MSTCHECKVKYDALPRHLEFGIGRYICQNETCDHRTFYQRCHATQDVRCFNCNDLVRYPYIHPKFRKSEHKRKRKPLDPNAKPFVPPHPTVPLLPPFIPPIIFYQQAAIPPQAAISPQLLQRNQAQTRKVRKKIVKKKMVINPSTPHVSTGSTIGTFLTQSMASDFDVDLQNPDSDSDEEVILPSSDSDSSSDEEKEPSTASCQSDDESEVEVDSMAPMYPSDSDSDSEGNEGNDHRKRTVASDTSDSSDTDEDDATAPSESSSGKLSSQASTMPDSGIGTASDTDSMASVDGAKPVSIGNSVYIYYKLVFQLFLQLQVMLSSVF